MSRKSTDKTFSAAGGERWFWFVAALLGLVFLAYFLQAYRFSELSRRQAREERNRFFGRGLNGL